MKRYMRYILAGSVVIVAVAAPVLFQLTSATATDIVTLTVKDNGFAFDGKDIHISNYAPGSRAEITYVIVNKSENKIKPEIYLRLNVDPSTYSLGKNYNTTPSYYSDWVDVPMCGTISPGDTKMYNVVLRVPADCQEVFPEKWAFKVGVDPGNQDGMMSNTCAVWWRVDMK